MRRTLLAACLVVLSACDDAAPPSAAAPQVTEVLPDVVFQGELGETRFHASDSAVVIRAQWPANGPGDLQVLELEDPNGTLFFRDRMALADDGAAAFRLALRGTVVEDYGMTGTWTARFYKNAAREPAHQVTFDIQP